MVTWRTKVIMKEWWSYVALHGGAEFSTWVCMHGRIFPGRIFVRFSSHARLRYARTYLPYIAHICMHDAAAWKLVQVLTDGWRRSVVKRRRKSVRKVLTDGWINFIGRSARMPTQTQQKPRVAPSIASLRPRLSARRAPPADGSINKNGTD
jgi:hypothetical protein